MARGSTCTGEEILPIDKRALHSIFKNLLHNSFVHGQADEVSVELTKRNNKFELDYKDNGKAFDGSLDQLGQEPQSSPQGSGFGLYIVRLWVKKLGGSIDFQKSSSDSLSIQVKLPGGGS